ncbi:MULTISPECIES: HWE histidine kinase domain-containing protein [unclassified Roseitalea]|uniref:sensor histidine kinase n=1 Tax=unclassified Roseitalea TaxID=2639107 RepID=UPI00273E39C1|nr:MULTISPECIES: HWE histidine kinase domain-containing protein [unclassified Roseitalea]
MDDEEERLPEGQAPPATEQASEEPSDTFLEMSAELRQQVALKSSGAATWVWDLASDLVDADPNLPRLFGMPFGRGPFTGAVLLKHVHVGDRARVEAAMATTIADGTQYEERFRVTDGLGQERWLLGTGEVYRRDAQGRASIIIGMNHDVTEQVHAEQRLLAVIGEMRHRIKNSLAMVNSLAAATARETNQISDYVQKLRGRIDALAAAQHAIGTVADAELASVSEAVDGALAPFIGARAWAPRISVHVDDIAVPPSLGQALALTIYELATNAIKYGAFARETGEISLSCRAGKNPDGLELVWDEQHAGQAIDTQQESSGFGNVLIDRLIAAEKGVIERVAGERGYRVTIRFVLH